MAKRFRAMLVAVLATLLVAPMPLTLETASAANPSQPGLDFAEVSAGESHSLAITEDGSLYAWGDNYYGQLGDETTDAKGAPVLISVDGKKVAAVSAGWYHSLAITEDGSLYAWGANWSGQLGDTTNDDRNSPVAIMPGTSFKAVSARYDHSLAITEDGSLYAWGDNYYGQLGDETTANSNVPVEISVGGKTFQAVAAGWYHSLAITEDGSLYAWGRNRFGQLGNGSETDSNTPVLISVAGKTFQAVAAGWGHTLAITTDGSLYAWGDNYNGAIGDGTTIDKNIPVLISVEGKTIEAVAAGDYHSLAIATDGSLYAWGYNGQGQLGNGSQTQSNTPVLISMPGKTFKAVAASGEHSLAIKTDGSLYAWGSHGSGQLGFGTTSTDVPLDTGAELRFSAISAGKHHTLAITEDGSLYAWGRNRFGQLGNGSIIRSNTPVAIMPGKTFKAVSAGDDHSLAVTTDGSLYAWGYNNRGQLGNDSTANSNVPVAISVAGKTFKAVAAGDWHSLAITEDGLLYAWGLNGYGQLGNGFSESISNTPVLISVDDKTFKAVSAGEFHSLAITEDGSLYAWGRNTSGQLGDGSETTSNTPVLISVDGKTFKAVSAGFVHSLAITEDGSLYAWGYNNRGQLGNDSTANSNVPVEISVGGKSFQAVAAGEYHSLAITEDGSLYAWGRNEFGQLGNESRTDSNTPVLISVAVKTFKAVSAGGRHSLAITEDGSLYAWGDNKLGELGNPSIPTTYYFQPTWLSGSGASSAESANPAPTAYAGPLATSFSASVVSAGDDLTISGQRLDTVSGITIDGVDVSIAAQTEASLSIVIPAGLEPGVKSLKIASTAGMLTVQGAFRLLEDAEIQPETSSSSATKGWTKRLTDTTVKIYAKDLVGAGKIQFMFNGEEIAWVNATSADDPKLRSAGGASYLVRTVNLVPGQKNVFEVHLDGERIRRSAYSY